MYQRCVPITRFDKSTFPLVRLCLVWFAGLSLGCSAARFYGDALEACVVLSVDCLPTVFGALSVNVLPLLISAFAVFLFQSLVYPVCFLRGMLLGIGFGAVCCVYRGAGLMMSLLLMFSAVAFSPVMLWYFFRRLLRGKEGLFRDLSVCVLIALGVALTDWGIISPMLREIINL